MSIKSYFSKPYFCKFDFPTGFHLGGCHPLSMSEVFGMHPWFRRLPRALSGGHGEASPAGQPRPQPAWPAGFRNNHICSLASSTTDAGVTTRWQRLPPCPYTLTTSGRDKAVPWAPLSPSLWPAGPFLCARLAGSSPPITPLHQFASLASPTSVSTHVAFLSSMDFLLRPTRCHSLHP